MTKVICHIKVVALQVLKERDADNDNYFSVIRSNTRPLARLIFRTRTENFFES